MINLNEFSLYYFSEVSVDITYQYSSDRESYITTATHPTDTVSIECWYHFIDSNISKSDDPLYFESHNSVEPVALMAGELSPAAEHILSQHDVDEPKRQFFTDFMCAFAHTSYNINNGRDTTYIHDAGDWLLEQYKDLSS